jgi:hypothetical protein
LTATYSGSSQDDPSTSPPVTITIEPSLVATTTTLSSSASQITQGQSFWLSAAVTANSGSGTPSGTISFYLGQTQIGAAALIGGKATLSQTSSFSPGTYNLTATYSGSSQDDASTSSPVVITIAPSFVATTTTLSIDPQQPLAGQTMVLQVNVRTAAANNLPSGTVTLYLNGTPIGIFMVANGTGTFSMQTPKAGTYSASAVFATQGEYLTSQSPPVNFTVQANTPPAPSGSFTVALSRDSVSLSKSQPASLQVLLSPSGNYTGSIQLSCSGLPTGISCNFSPASLTLNAAKATSTLVLSGQIVQASNDQMRVNLGQEILLPWEILGMLGIASRRRRLRGPHTTFLILPLALLCFTLWTAGCGLTINNISRSYLVRVTALDQNQVTESTTFTLNVTQPGMVF